MSKNLSSTQKMIADRVAARKKLNSTQVSQVKKIIHKEGETKHHTTIAGFTAIDVFTPHNACLSLVSQGDNDSQRNGDKIEIKNINIRMRLDIQDSLTSPIATCFRVMVIQDKNYNTASAIDLARVLTSPFTTSQRNVDHLKTQVVLYDQLHTISTEKAAKTFVIKPNLKFLKRGVQWVASSTINQTGGIYLVIINDSNVATDPQFEYSARITYTDK